MAITVDLITADQRSELIELYVAYFNRAPDADGLSYWASQILNGWSTEDVARSFFEQPEVEAAYPASMTTSEFIDQVYQNVLNRTPDTDGKNYWIDALDSGLAREKFILAIIEAAKSPTGSQDDADTLANKTAAGEHFAIELGLNDVNLARIALQGNGVDDGDVGVTNDPATATDAAVDARINAIIINGDTELAAAETTTLLDIKGATSPIAISDVTADIITIDYDANTITGEDDQFIGIGEIPTTGSAAQPVLTLTQGVNNPAAIETVTLHSGAFENVADNTLGDIVVGQTLTTLNIQGGSNLTVVNPLDENIATVDASSLDANLTLDMTASVVDTRYIGAQGEDTVTFDVTTANNISGNAGNDTFNFGEDGLTIADTVSGGAGVDRIVITERDDIQRSETENVSGVEVIELQQSGSLLVVTDNLLTGGGEPLEGSFTVDTRSESPDLAWEDGEVQLSVPNWSAWALDAPGVADSGHVIDLSDATTTGGSGFAYTGGDGADALLISDILLNSSSVLDFGGSYQDQMRIVNGATVTADDFDNISGLEAILLVSDSTQPQTWSLELNTSVFDADKNPNLRLYVDPTVPQGSVLNVTGTAADAGLIIVYANANVTVNGAPVSVVNEHEFTENADNLEGTNGDDVFHATSLDQIQGTDVADAGGNTNLDNDATTINDINHEVNSIGALGDGDTLLLDFAIANATLSAVAQLSFPNLSNFETLRFNTTNNIGLTDDGTFDKYYMNQGNDVFNAPVFGDIVFAYMDDGDDVINTDSLALDGDGVDSPEALDGSYLYDGDDVLNGGNGNDTLNLDASLSSSLYPIDPVTGIGVPGAFDFQFTGISNIETLNLVGGDDILAGGREFEETGLGQGEGNWINGNGGNDQISFTNESALTIAPFAGIRDIDHGVAGHVSTVTSLNINAGAGNDDVAGGSGNDTIIDGTGSDRIIGATGADVINLTNDASVDYVIYSRAGDGANINNPGSGWDTITGFTTTFGNDYIAIEGELLAAITGNSTVAMTVSTENAAALDISQTDLATYTSTSLSDAALLDTSNGGQLLTYLNNSLDTASAGEAVIYSVQGASNTGVYFYQENGGDNIVDSSEIRMLANVENALLKDYDFTSTIADPVIVAPPVANNQIDFGFGNNSTDLTGDNAVNETFFMDAVNALLDADGGNTQVTGFQFDVVNDILRIDLPTADATITTLDQLNGQQGVVVQTNAILNNTLINFGNDANGGELVSITLDGIVDPVTVNVEIV